MLAGDWGGGGGGGGMQLNGCAVLAAQADGLHGQRIDSCMQYVCLFTN